MENIPPNVGAKVRIKNLKNADYYNGLDGQVIEVYPTEGRLLVSLEGNRQLKLKIENVEVISPGPAPATSTAADSSAECSCAVCYEDFVDKDRAVLPCCGTRESTVQYCRRCIEIIIERGIDGNLGRCPTCSTYLQKSGGVFKVFDQTAGRCRMCMQQKVAYFLL
jgi:hypothetical protein